MLRRTTLAASGQSQRTVPASRSTGDESVKTNSRAPSGLLSIPGRSGDEE